MTKFLTLLLLTLSTLVFGQTKPETYRFSADILNQIDKDTVAWKYQTGAAELSFSEYYKDVLRIWDKNGLRKPNDIPADSLFYINSKKIPAKDYIINQSKAAQIIIINEAHHIPRHRTFTHSLLLGLYKNGYRYLGLEALFDTLINVRKYPVLESGYYTKEPEFGTMVQEALKIGFTVFGYEAAPGKNNKAREIEQAANIQRFIETHPKGKVLIHCGFAHAYENDYAAWGKAMAGRLKDLLKIDPLTIDQTMFVEKSDVVNNSLFNRLNRTGEPIVLIDNNGAVFNGKGQNNQTDIVVIHPITHYVDGRPDWFVKGKTRYSIPSSKLNNNQAILALAYRKGEFKNNGIPADVIEITKDSPSRNLYLPAGKYELVIKDFNYAIIQQYPISIK